MIFTRPLPSGFALFFAIGYDLPSALLGNRKDIFVPFVDDSDNGFGADVETFDEETPVERVIRVPIVLCDVSNAFAPNSVSAESM